MSKKLIYLLNTIIKKIRYRKTIQFKGILHADYLTDIYTCNEGTIQIGYNTYIDKYTRASATDKGCLNIGNNVYFNRACIVCCRDNIVIEDNCSFGPGVMIYDHDHGFDNRGYNNKYKLEPISIGKNCWIGAGAIILRGTCIGENSVIGAGCIVQGRIPENSLVVSNRSLKIKNIN